MEYISLPGTDLRLSRIIMGCEPLGGTDWGPVDRGQAVKAVHHALDIGINAFDVADVYGLGRGEETLGEALGPERHDAFVITKFGVNWRKAAGSDRAITFRDASPARVREALENSLRRLRLECIPLYLVHWPDPATPLEATLEVLLKCRNEGKIRYFGLSNFPAAMIRQALAISVPVAVELNYSMLERNADDEVLPLCREKEIAALAYGCLAQGLLTGKYGEESTFDDNDRRYRLPHFAKEAWPRNNALLSKLRAVAAENGKTVAQVAIRWALDQPGIACAVVGAKTPEQVTANAGAVGWPMAGGWPAIDL